MGLICPTVTAYSVEEYKDQIDLVTSFAKNIHVDLMDGDFAKPQSVGLEDVWWPQNMESTVHLMYDEVQSSLPRLVALSPSLVIVHAESSDDIPTFFRHLKEHGIRTGIALFQSTKVADATELIKLADHVMLFSGKLGSFGGTADMSQLSKISEIHEIKTNIEIGWDGGVTLDTASQISDAGVDILFVGGAIHKANNPRNAFQALYYKVNN